MEENRIDIKTRILYILMFVLTGVLVWGFSFLTGKSYEIILRNTVVALLISGIIIFMLEDAISRGKDGFSYDNYYHKNRFAVIYLFVLVLSCLFALISNLLWPYMAIIVILGLFSNNEIGIASGIGFVTISVMLEDNGSYMELFMFVLAGMIALQMFRNLQEDSSIGIPVAISLLSQTVLLTAFNILFQNRTFSVKVLTMPIINLMLNLIILLIFLNMFGVYIIRKSNDMYMEINDAGFPLLVKLKDSNKDEYYRSIHTGYLAERIANGLGINARAVKTCSYYHRIGILDGKTSWEDVNHYYYDNKFPVEAIEFLHEYIEIPKTQVRSKEFLATNLAETVVSSILSVFKDDKNAKIDYENLINSIMNKKMEDGELKNYDVTFKEYDQMRKILIKEKLYYDFLR